MNYRTLYVTVVQVGVAKLNRALPASSDVHHSLNSTLAGKAENSWKFRFFGGRGEILMWVSSQTLKGLWCHSIFLK